MLVELPGRRAFDEPLAGSAARTRPALVIYRFGAALFFANESRFRQEVEHLTGPDEPAVCWFVLDASAINDIDTSGALALEHVVTSSGGPSDVAVRRLQPQVRVGLERYGLVELIGADRLYTTNRGAAEAFERAGVTAPARAD